MDEIVFHRFERLIAAHTGLQLRPRECDALHIALAARIAALHLRHADEYHQLLQAGTPEAESEWQLLIARLTNNESYFFRDKGQMALLRERILPELITRNKARRTLRLWSAGCSTGEEAYSLALLVDELLPRSGADTGRKWKIIILGTDIDEQALQQARRGIYGSWSFRAMEPAQRQRYFHRLEDGWQVGEASRSLVTFSRYNLVADGFPSSAMGIHDMDLILCRNVFIYFAREAISAVLPRFAQTLREGGYLMTGHAEIQGQIVEPLQARMFPESVVYQRVSQASSGVGITETKIRWPAGKVAGRTADAPRSQPLTAPTSQCLPSFTQRIATTDITPQTSPSQTVTAERALAEAEAFYTAGDYPAVVGVLQPLSEAAGDKATMLYAHAHANLGHYEEAAECCQRVIKNFPLASASYELMAAIAQEQKRYDEARLLLKKALYLAPTSPSAYMELGALYYSEGDRKRARKMHVTALELLKQMPAEAIVGIFGGPSAQEWILHLNQLLAEEE